MSTTPRTDAAESIHGEGNAMHAHCHDDTHLSSAFADFARQLETELIAITAERDRLRDIKWEGITALENQRDQLLATVEGLREALVFCQHELDNQQKDNAWKVANDALQSSVSPTNLVKRSVLEKLVNSVMECGAANDHFKLEQAMEEANEELQRTKL